MRVVSLAVLIALGALVGCSANRSASEPAEEYEDEDEDHGGGLFGNFDLFGSLLSGQLGQPGPYAEPRQSARYDAGKPHYAVIELGESVVEVQSFSLLSPARGTKLREITDTLRELAAQDNLAGVLLRAGNAELSMATAEELRAALLRFKAEGERRLVCHTEGVSHVMYYVLTACDAIGLAPGGSIVISGPVATPVHVRGLLDKMGLRPDYLHVGAYKSAAEALTRDSPSREYKQTIDDLLDQAYETLLAGVSAGRGLERAAVMRLVDTAMFHDQEAATAGLVDAVSVFEAFRDQMVNDAGWTVVRVGKSQEPELMEIMRRLGLMPHARPWTPHVALVYAVGPVIDGKGSGVLGARDEIASRTLAAALRVMAADDKVKAVVLRIDSPGGSALASEIIWAAVAELREKKPVIVSMASVAASGGYYIGTGATRIFATENTITGSIGVVGGKLAMREGLGKIGVTAHPMGRGRRALIGSAIDVWTAEERAMVQGWMEAVYETFVGRVAAGRGKAPAEVKAVAEGRVWTGAAARQHGLVDEIGGLEEALAEARRLGGVEESVDLEIYPPVPTLLDILSSLGETEVSAGPGRMLADAAHGLARELGPAEARAVVQMVSLALLVRDAPVLAAAFVPVVR